MPLTVRYIEDDEIDFLIVITAIFSDFSIDLFYHTSIKNRINNKLFEYYFTIIRYGCELIFTF